MALSRCKEKHHHPNGRKEEYIEFVLPIGYPKTSSICGRKNCNHPGVVWLTKEEYNLYLQGETIFIYASAHIFVSNLNIIKIPLINN